MRRLPTAIGILGITYLVFLQNFTPKLTGNESVYLILSRRILDVEFLAQDWTWSGSVMGLSFLFSLLVSPLWLISKDPVTVALTCRILVWVPLVWSLVYCLKSFGMKTGAWIVSLIVWLICGQALVAGEWVVGGAEQKVVAYILVFFALGAMNKERPYLTFLFLGLASLFHLLVGFWASMAVFGAWAYTFRHKGFLSVGTFTLRIMPFYIPTVVNVMIFLTRPKPHSEISAGQINELLVLFRNPHHLDPKVFLGLVPFLGTLLMYFFTTFVFSRSLPNGSRKRIQLFLSILLGQFLFGLLARQLEWYGMLTIYPFRVFDVFLPFLFYSLGINWLIEESGSHLSWQTFLPRKRNIEFITGLFFLLAIVGSKVDLNLSSPLQPLAQFKDNGTPDPFLEVCRWAKANTSPDEAFIMDPFYGSFWIQGERPMVANWKYAPAGARFVTWYERIAALNGGNAPQSTGWDFSYEISKNLQSLSEEDLGEISRNYRARYFLIKGERPDLAEYMCFSSGDFHVYDIAPKGASAE